MSDKDPSDWRSWVRESFRDQYQRSVSIRDDMFSLVPAAKQTLSNVMDDDYLPMTEKSAPTKVRAAEIVLRNQLIDHPIISFSTVEASMRQEATQSALPPAKECTMLELLEAAKEAVRAEEDLLMERMKQDSSVIEAEIYSEIEEDK